MKLRTDARIPGFSDPLGETLHLLRLTGTLYCRSELTAPWGIDMPPFEGYMMFHVVTDGHCWLEVEGEEPRLLQRGLRRICRCPGKRGPSGVCGFSR